MQRAYNKIDLISEGLIMIKVKNIEVRNMNFHDDELFGDGIKKKRPYLVESKKPEMGVFHKNPVDELDMMVLRVHFGGELL